MAPNMTSSMMCSQLLRITDDNSHVAPGTIDLRLNSSKPILMISSCWHHTRELFAKSHISISKFARYRKKHFTVVLLHCFHEIHKQFFYECSVIIMGIQFVYNFAFRIYTNDLLSASSSAWKDSRGVAGVERSSGRERREKDRDHAQDTSRHDNKKLYFEKPVEEVSSK